MCQDRPTSLGTLALKATLARKFVFDSVIEVFASVKLAKQLWTQASFNYQSSFN
jgi:hypothetical protein